MSHHIPTRLPLRQGSVGGAVRTLQAALNDSGVRPRVSVHGTFDEATESAVKRLQAANELEVDGVVTAETWAAFQGGEEGGDD